jgi:hypothetical protein
MERARAERTDAWLSGIEWLSGGTVPD